MAICPIDHKDSVIFVDTKHTKSCRRYVEECLCLLVSKPILCYSCTKYELSAPRCKACRIIFAGRKAYVAAARRMMRKKR